MKMTERSRVLGLIAVVAILLAGVSAWGAVTGVVSGAVMDKETGAALSGTNIGLMGTELRTVTDEHGRFVITNVPPGSYAVEVSLIGYAEARVEELVVVQGQVASVEVELEPTVVEAVGAEVVVTAPRVALREDVTASVYVTTSADEQLTLSQPNDRYQFPGLVFAQPGVVPDSTFYPHIRGARSNQVGYFLDGIPITEPNTNVFATNIVSIGLDRLELFTGGYPAEYGGFTGGIINQVVKRGDQIRGGLVDVGGGSPYDFGGLILERGDVEDRVNWYYGLSSWHSNFNENLFTSSAPTVSDHMAKVIYDAGDRDSVTLLSHHGYARYLMPWERMWSFDPVANDWYGVRSGEDYARQGHNLDAITLNHTVDAKAFWTLRFSRLQHYLQLELGDESNLYWQDRSERMFTGQFDYERQMGDHRVRAGLWRIDSDNDSQYSVLMFPVSFVSDNDTKNTQAYLQDTWDVGERLTLTLGGRYEKMKYDRAGWGDLKLSESSGRGGFTYEASPALLVRGSYGKYVEFPRANLIAYRYAGTDFGWYDFLAPEFPVKPQLDRGQELGMEWKADEGTLVTATWFRRDSEQMMQRWHGATDALSDFDDMSPVWFASNGTGTARGAEVKVDRRLSGNLRGWLSYTHMDATATSPRDNIYPYGYGFLNRTDAAGLAEEYPVDWNQEQTVVLAAAYRMGKVTVNPWVTYGSGFPYGQSGLDLGGSDPAHVPNPNYDPGDPGSPMELVVPENYLNPSDPGQGFITPNSLETDKNVTVSLNLSYEMEPGRQVYLQVYNVFGRDDVTSYVIGHPQTGGLIGRVEGDNIYYVPFSRTPPRFVALGVRQEF